VLKHFNALKRLFEDSPEFMARAIARSARLNLDRLAPPFLKR
jgi:arginine decarboxylase